jgi:hypothetical protein
VGREKEKFELFNNGVKIRFASNMLDTYKSGFRFIPKQSPSSGDLNITGTIAWFDADASRVTKDGSNRVSRITDKSPILVDQVQNTLVAQPTWYDNQINGQPAIQFQEEIFLTSDKWWTQSESIPSEYGLTDGITMVTVFNWNIAMYNTSDFHLIFGNCETSFANEGYAQYLQGASLESNWYAGDDNVANTRLDLTQNTWYYMLSKWSKTDASGLLSQDINGLGIDTDNYTLDIPASTQTLGLGGGNSVSLRGFGGMIAEAILIDHKVTATEESQIDSYINSKYGL